MIQNKVIDKICKCLRLAESTNPNEAAAALRQAQGLMRKYGVHQGQVNTGAIGEAAVCAGRKSQPPYWIMALSNLVAEAFVCRVYISRRQYQATEFVYIGQGYSAEIAAYTFTVLYRALGRARIRYIKSLQRVSRKEKIRRGNVFAQAWLFRANIKVQQFVNVAGQLDSVDSYVCEKYGQTVDYARTPDSTDVPDYNDIISGMRSADKVGLYRAMKRQSAMNLPA